jgi:zeaxanthin glucosyltransferase
METLRIDAVIGDQLEPAAFLIAEHLGLPAIAVASALPINREPGLPLPYLDWPFDRSPQGIKRAKGGDRVADWLSRKHGAVIAGWAERWNLVPRQTLHDCLPPAQIAQVLEGLDFPRSHPAPFTAVGPIRRAEPRSSTLPFTPDPAKPFVFASLGTVQGHRWRLFRAVTQAVHRAGGQIAVAHCGKLSPTVAARVGADWITDFLPQRATIARADLVVCHAGLNTVLDAIEAGVPVLARPIAFDQKGTAARLVHHGLGERMAKGQRALDQQVARMLGDTALRERARALGSTVSAAGGTERAVQLIEQALTAHNPGSSKLVSP